VRKPPRRQEWLDPGDDEAQPPLVPMSEEELKKASGIVSTETFAAAQA
jgi:hypothetical protein